MLGNRFKAFYAWGKGVLRELAELLMRTQHSGDDDWIFPSYKLSGSIPMCARIFVTDHLRPAALAAGIKIADGQAIRSAFSAFQHGPQVRWYTQRLPLRRTEV
jgi:hypothetical protein